MSTAPPDPPCSNSNRITELENKVKSLEGVISALRFSNEQLRKFDVREYEVAELRAELKDSRDLQEKDRIRLIRLLRVTNKFGLPLPPDDVPAEEYAGEEYISRLANTVQDRVDAFVARARVSKDLTDNKYVRECMQVLLGASSIMLTDDGRIQMKLSNPRNDLTIAFSLLLGTKFMVYQPVTIPTGDVPYFIKERYSFLKDEAPLFIRRLLGYIFEESSSGG